MIPFLAGVDGWLAAAAGVNGVAGTGTSSSTSHPDPAGVLSSSSDRHSRSLEVDRR